MKILALIIVVLTVTLQSQPVQAATGPFHPIESFIGPLRPVDSFGGPLRP